VYRTGEDGLTADGLIARFTYDALGHRTSAVYDTNGDGVLTDESIDLYGYDMAWRLVTVVQYDPPGTAVAGLVSGEGGPSFEVPATVRVRERYFYHAAGDGSAAYGTASGGVAGSDTPIMRLVDRNLDGNFDGYAEQQYFLANWRGDISAIMTPNPIAGQPGIVLAKVKYDAYGKPMIYHPADFDRDGWVGGSLSSEYEEDETAMESVLAMAPFTEVNSSNVDAKLRAWRAWVNIAGVPPPTTSPFPSVAWDDWKVDQRDRQLAVAGTMLANGVLSGTGDVTKWQEFFGNLPLYAGYWWDAKLDLYHVRHRVYDPVAGRWLQRDPIGYAGGDNLYGYGPNSPHIGSDPMGLWWLSEIVDGFIEDPLLPLSDASDAVSTMVKAIGGKLNELYVEYVSGTGESDASRALDSTEKALRHDRDNKSLGSSDAGADFGLDYLGRSRRNFGKCGDMAEDAVWDLATGGGATGGVAGVASNFAAVPFLAWVKKDLNSVGTAGKSAGVRILDEPGLRAKFAEYSTLPHRDVTPSGFPGKIIEMEDGTRVSLREKSKSGGVTLDIDGGKNGKIHIP
jgi:RHS repeat-associated protein